MPSVGSFVSGQPLLSPQAQSTLLYTTLAFALIAFFASIYTTLRTLLPLLGAHPLERRTTGSAVGIYGAPPSPRIVKKPRLTSAQRFTAYLALTDILAACILVWEVAVATTSAKGLAGTKGGASRLSLALTAHPTLLLVVAVLSYFNVMQGRSIALGRADWIVWTPALVLLAVGAGLASLPTVGSMAVWIGLISWVTFTTTVVSICFGRLLVAILRVRKTTIEQDGSPWALEQERIVSQRRASQASTVSRVFLPPLHTNFSGLSAPFVTTVGRSSSSLHHSNSSHDVLPFTSSNVPDVSYSPRPSLGDVESVRDFRSPTPGSTHGLLASLRQTVSGISSPASTYSQTPKANRQAPHCSTPTSDHEILTFEELPRPSIGSFASASTYMTGNLVGSPAMQKAIVKEVWGTSTPPGTGHSPKVELSRKEARGALVRIGGHLFAGILTYALVVPFLFLRLCDPESVPPLTTAILLVLGVSQPGLVLALQCGLSEGLWYRVERPPVLTSSSAADLERLEKEELEEMEERPMSRASMFTKSHATLPGIQPDGEDCIEEPKGAFGRALSMVQTHPKLLVLPSGPTKDSTTSGFNAEPKTNGHARLRSLKLSKISLASIGASERPQQRERSDNRATVFEKPPPSRSATPVHPDDELITRSLLNKAKRRASLVSPGQVPFGFASNRSTDNLLKGTPSPSPSTPSFNFSTREVDTLSLPPTPHLTPRSTTPEDFAIDSLSSQVLPILVPSVVVGKSTIIDDTSLNNRRRSSFGDVAHAASTRPAPKRRNHRNLSLPNLLSTLSSRKSTGVEDSTWLSVDGQRDEFGASLSPASQSPSPRTSESTILSIARNVREGQTERKQRPLSHSRRPSTDRSAKERTASTRLHHAEIRSPTSHLYPPESSINDEETEVLEEEHNFADQSSDDDNDDEVQQAALAAHRTGRSPSPAALPTSPTEPDWQHLDESVVLRGSQVLDESDEEVGTVHCATIRPVSRASGTSSLSSQSMYSLRPTATHQQPGSLSSTRSFASDMSSSLTSAGFRNLLETNNWHTREDGVSSSEERSSGGERSPPPQRTTGLRPLSLLSNRDSNISSASDTDNSDKEAKKVARHRLATSRRTSTSGIPLPPIPATIEEVEEDRKSGTPTPRARRQRGTPASDTRNASPPIPLTSTPPPPPSRTPPNITSRSRARHHRGVRGYTSSGDENDPEAIARSLRPTAPLRITASGARGLR